MAGFICLPLLLLFPDGGGEEISQFYSFLFLFLC